MAENDPRCDGCKWGRPKPIPEANSENPRPKVSCYAEPDGPRTVNPDHWCRLNIDK